MGCCTCKKTNLNESIYELASHVSDVDQRKENYWDHQNQNLYHTRNASSKIDISRGTLSLNLNSIHANTILEENEIIISNREINGTSIIVCHENIDKKEKILSITDIDNYNKEMFELINKLRQNPASFINVIQNYKKSIRIEKGINSNHNTNNKNHDKYFNMFYLVIPEYSIRIPLIKGEAQFDEICGELKAIGLNSKVNIEEEKQSISMIADNGRKTNNEFSKQCLENDNKSKEFQKSTTFQEDGNLYSNDADCLTTNQEILPHLTYKKLLEIDLPEIKSSPRNSSELIIDNEFNKDYLSVNYIKHYKKLLAEGISIIGFHYDICPLIPELSVVLQLVDDNNSNGQRRINLLNKSCEYIGIKTIPFSKNTVCSFITIGKLIDEN